MKMYDDTPTPSEKKKETKRILVVTSCTKDKIRFQGLPKSQYLKSEDLWDERGDERALRNFGELEQFRIKAYRLYKGLQHRQLMQGVSLLRQSLGDEGVEVKIVSAGFGVIDEEQELPPYDVTFSSLSKKQISVISNRLGIPQKIEQLLVGNYDCAFFLLGETYLSSLSLPFRKQPNFPCLFFVNRASRKSIPIQDPYFPVPLERGDARIYRCNLVGLRGKLLHLFAQQITTPVKHKLIPMFNSCSTPEERLRSFLINPTSTHFFEIIEPLREETSQRGSVPESMYQPSLFDIISTPDAKRAKNYGRPMRYFIPDWDDRVDPDYNFILDQGAPGKRKYYDEVYAHEIYAQPNYDGLLFSKSTVEDGASKRSLVAEAGIHKFARFNGPIIGDCGAFSYVNCETPPYQNRDILDYYQVMGFDYGVSVDHLIIPSFANCREFRYQLTRNNAREFLELHRAGRYTFVPIGVAQGWSLDTYKQAVIELLDWGYKYIALGGLARAQTKEIHGIVESITPFLHEDTDLHLFGVARDREGEEMEGFRRLGVTSFDSATYLRRAWMSATTNYFTEDGNRYTALRISPIYESSPRVRSLVSDGISTLGQLKHLEQEALKAVRAFDRGELNVDATLDVLLEIDKLEGYSYDQHKVLYRRTLEDQPWKKCSCEVCRALGIEVIIFRGNDRNRRRGFHNTYVFYKRFRALVGAKASR